MIQYRFRLNIGRHEARYGLTKHDLLVGRRQQFEVSISLADIESVNLQCHGRTLGHVMYRCVIRTRRKTILLSNIHYRGLARIEARNREYRHFVLSLHQTLAAGGHRVRFYTGHPMQKLFGLALLVITPAIVVAAVAVWLIQGAAAGLGIGALGIAGFSAWAQDSVRRGTRQLYDPRTPPQSYLPESDRQGVGPSRGLQSRHRQDQATVKATIDS